MTARTHCSELGVVDNDPLAPNTSPLASSVCNSRLDALLMEAGVSYNKQRLHKAGYFRELLATNPDIN